LAGTDPRTSIAAMFQRPYILALFLILILGLMACRPEDAPAAELIPADNPPTAPEATLPAAEPTLTASPTANDPATASPPTPATAVPPTLAPAAAASPTWPSGSVEQRCGILLPLANGSAEPAVQELPGRTVPPGLVPEAALPALQRILDAPGTVGLAAFQVGLEGSGVYLNADSPMPLASVVKVINLIAYAEAANAGLLDPAEWRPLGDLERYYLPGSDLRSHSQAVSDLEEAGLVAFDPPATPLEEIPGLMIRRSSNAASDYLHKLLGQETIEQTVLNLGLSQHTAPCPFVGQFLAMGNRTRTSDDRQAVQGFIEDPDSYGREVMRLTELFATDEAFHDYESTPRWQHPNLQIQALFSDHLTAQGTAGDYAQLMARIAQNEIGPPYVNILVRRYLEWPMIFNANQELFSTVGYKNGTMPGVLTTIYYAQRLEDGALVVVALFYRQLPMNQYQNWRRNLPYDELARWLLADPQAIPALAQLLGS
jgi:D-alanyl-D-alanine carboxypeptidase